VKPSASPLGRVLLAVGLGAAALYLLGLALPSPPLRLAAKAVPVLCLAAGVASRATGALSRLVVAGLLLSAAGDLLLELGRFLPGLAAFLAAHVAYALAFLSETRRPALGRSIPFALYGIAVFLFLLPGLGAQAGAVLAYTVAICAMLWRAAARVGASGRADGAWLGLAGALLFAASDTLIALDRFHASLPWARYPIILLYWLGQLGIAASASPRDGRRL
jgi:alkenylglycerophosphocholine hydrolase